MTTRTNIMSGIYTAEDCTDLSDCEIAIAACRKLARKREIEGLPTASVWKRINSLIKKENELKQK
ncbi:MAG: hypothetical protein WC055_01955 [Melioribacteraceae bacterium]